MHKLLARQLRRHFGTVESIPAEIQAFVDAVEQAYIQSDDDRALLEHSMETMSEELGDRFRRQQNALAESQTAKDRLNQAVSLLSATLESTADGILVVDRAGRIVQANGTFQVLWRIPDDVIETGLDDDALKYVAQQLADPDAFVRKVRELYDKPAAESFDELLFKDGRIMERYSRPQRVGGDIVGRVWSFRDVTARRQLEEQLRHSQKMEAVGTLAGGIAHDFNNLLTVMRGHLELLNGALPPSDPAHADVDAAMNAAERAATMTRQLLAYSRKQMLKPVSLDLGEVVDSLAPMLRRLIGANISIAVDVQPGLGVIMADRGQMEQVLVNLVVNARDAVSNGGHIAVSTRNVRLNASDEFERGHGLPTGEFVLLSVADNGSGVQPEDRARIFEPFFTTKETGKGTGLGLSTVFGVVKQSGGFLILESVVGQGSEFKVFLPRIAAARGTAPSSKAAPGRRRGSETVLVSEDEEVLRTLVRRMLEADGYRVLVAESDEETLRLARAHAGAIDLLLTDVVMPGIGGIALATAIEAISPGVRVLFMSGYAAEESGHQFAEGSHLLEKPFTGAALSRAVRGVLDRPAMTHP